MPAGMTAEQGRLQLHDRALQFKDSEKKKGRILTYAQAVDSVVKTSTPADYKSWLTGLQVFISQWLIESLPNDGEQLAIDFQDRTDEYIAGHPMPTK